ncbi:Ankyrin-1 [Colletotrichum siamense]|uniref:Ankyrin-1 n=1 Tax=Colletotrichum siamense TaxID=690259 RepID=A0A9P5BP27_COLSI|nr:Ankyrin-1 [Colletotrichum siamense]KAF4846287.1 Ankyrin-1 [Colletotrichum siamense]
MTYDETASTSNKRARLNDTDHGPMLFSARVLRTLSHDAYTVGWVAALPIEMAAAQAMLDDIHQPLPMNPNDSNVYAFGNIGNHNIVIACLPSGQYGITSAALVANNMRWSFPSIKIRLMVGIGGGVPDKVDIRLGDVVVSNPTAASPGVIQYDFGKTVQAGRFQLSGALNKPPQDLLAAVAKLRADHQLRPSRISDYLAGMRERNPSMDAYTYRGAGQDRLYEATYEHVGDSCDDCDLSQLVRRRPRSNNSPWIHYGIVASANQVMKHGQTRHHLAHELDVLCFEMEAAGLMDSFPCLVVRGICDYSDSHKANQWQEYAAATAAAYTKELLSVILPGQVHQNPITDVDMQPSRELVSSDHRTRLLDSLTFEEIDSRHSTIKTAHSKTCQWLLNHPDYIRWLSANEFNDHHGILWIRGKPGAGKSTIMKYALSRAGRKTANNAAVISFFFNARGGPLEKSTEGMHRSLLLQLLGKIPELQEVLDIANLRVSCLSSSRTWKLSELRDLFSRAVAKLGRRQVTCFIDALDECDEIEIRQMLDFFEDLGQNAIQNNTRFCVCFSSRHYPYIDVQYGIRLTLEDQQGHEADLERYIRSKLKTVARKQADELTQEILRKASGVFMWVVLVIDILNREFQRGRMFAVKSRLQEIPPRLSDLFRDILTRDNENMDDLLLSIQWILFSKRPLRLEYYFALVAGLEPDSLTEWDPDQITKQSINHFMVSSSKGLAEMTKSSNATVQFIHESVRDFLLKDDGLASLWPELGDNPKGRSHDCLKTYCHRYTKIDISAYVQPEQDFLQEDKKSAKTLRTKVTGKLPFLDYATKELLYHSNTAESLGISQQPFFQEFSASLDHWIKLHNLLEQFKVRRYAPRTDILYIFADLGFASLVDSRLRDNNQRSTHRWPNQRFRTPFHAAVNGGHINIVKGFLSNMGAEEVNDPVRKNETPLFTAVERRHAGIVELLLEAGADPNFQGSKPGVDLLSQAIETKRQDIAELLLSRNFSIRNSRELDSPAYPLVAEKGRCRRRSRLEIDLARCSDDVLYEAARNGQSTTVRLLLEKGAQVNFIPKERSSPLHAAVTSSDEFCARLLIENGADVNLIPPRFSSPLYTAVGSSKSCVELLIEHGADVNLVSPGFGSPLLAAVRASDESCLKLLIENGADVNITSKGFGSPLHEAVKSDEYWVKLLIESGADVNLVAKGLGSPLCLAIKKSQTSCARLLLDNGADVNVGSSTFQTPLYWAVNTDKRSMVKLVLENGANPDLPGDEYRGRTPLHLAISLANIPIALLLLEGGADIEPSGCDVSPLQLALRLGTEEISAILIEKGANINSTDDRGLTALHIAAQKGSLKAVKKFVQLGADIHCTDHKGRTPLLLACESHNYAVSALLFNRGARLREAGSSNNTLSYAEDLHNHVEQFLQLRADHINGRNELGQTPLFEACRLGAVDIVKLLLERGADAKVLDNEDQTALFAIQRSHVHSGRLVRLLVEAGADPMHENSKGLTFLYASDGFPKLEVWEMKEVFECIRQGQLDESKAIRTLLGQAAFHDDIARVNFLLYVGADPNKRYKGGGTPIYDVARYGATSVMNRLAHLLLEAGADVTIPGEDELSPVELAIKMKRYSFAELLRSRPE